MKRRSNHPSLLKMKNKNFDEFTGGPYGLFVGRHLLNNSIKMHGAEL
jgi:hypothetical protein